MSKYEFSEIHFRKTEIKMKDKKFFLIIGSLSLVVGIILNRFVEESSIASFMSGLLLGLSVVFNTVFLFSKRKLS
jgi:uncharacterized membrane protein HdeD (DUF308 family)